MCFRCRCCIQHTHSTDPDSVSDISTGLGWTLKLLKQVIAFFQASDLPSWLYFGLYGHLLFALDSTCVSMCTKLDFKTLFMDFIIIILFYLNNGDALHLPYAHMDLGLSLVLKLYL